MTYFQWRRFNFFDIEKDVDKGSLSESLKSGGGNAENSPGIPENSSAAADVTSVIGGRGLLALGDTQG
jgi:hypothetical protein